ncbi:hypothetical protein [Flavobacterium reichenbachii]|uniref:Heparinase n=1 Tax=Flavobacterium reichenbachii TaxID=362418 RepID=A0A085ZDX4_9FLAO|nr:hypothetical protein [Flavobacterium reichenbachii]KFF02638.1 hypothetical protein IW19_23515 [Flavobacterium reichenbachii]OXB11133.1 hypothetical protein B0A68_21150 [Flavobacterium reichenbachii]
MKNQISRGEFIRLSSLTLAGALVSNAVFANDLFLNNTTGKEDLELLKKLIVNNDAKVKSLLSKALPDPAVRLSSFRGIASSITIMTASLSNSGSEYYKSVLLTEKINESIDILLKEQYSDGTLDAGGNRQSPPDTAFILEYICPAAVLLKNHKQNDLAPLKDKLKKFILNAGEAMITGGVHTPNHRWVICAALANINALYPDVRYVSRIDEWLAEGIYMNEDGHYAERSGIYSAVIDKALITMARLLNRPKLLEIVHKNLTTYFYYTETNGDLVTVDSKRQDQFMSLKVTNFYLQYRYMAIKTNNAMFPYMVNLIEKLPEFTNDILSNSLAFFLENEVLRKQIPIESKVENDFEKFFAISNLARIRRGKTSLTLFGGNDQPVQIVSGRSSNPNFLMYRRGDSILKYMRLSTSFFRMGYFSSDGIVKEGNKYILKETKEADYYQPLAQEFRKADGDYKLSESPDGRFWNKMDFDSRTKSNVKKQTTTIEITEDNGALSLEFKVEGPPNVEVTIEMCFNEGSSIMGAVQDEKKNYFLKSGFGALGTGEDKIQFGPGKCEHLNVENLDSEEYTYHQGSLRTIGEHVYITGFTPFYHKMNIY